MALGLHLFNYVTLTIYCVNVKYNACVLQTVPLTSCLKNEDIPEVSDCVHY